MSTSTDHAQPNPEHAPLVDSHAHLDSEDYAADIDAVVGRARSFGLKAIITIGIEPADWQSTLALAARYTDIYPALGIHPNSADQTNDTTLEQLARLCKEHNVVGLGETGLDYYREYVSHEQQKDSFRRHLALARELDLPVIIHTRDAYDDVLEILRKDGKGTRGVMHSFSGDLPYALECVEMGYMISMSGPVTFRKAQDKHTLAREVPLEALIVETDCPYLTPEPYRGRRNEPAYVAYTAKAIAELRGIPLAELAEATTGNAARLFGLQLG
ncbi:MAG TPA: TatD family hydrolase [Chloroflexia bacterium]|nr:TatD family hydrolase [Chloroflexia bacterium]